MCYFTWWNRYHPNTIWRFSKVMESWITMTAITHHNAMSVLIIQGFAFMTLWAMLMVEFVHPLMEQMFRDGRAFQDCQECAEQASSVMRANLLLFKTAPELKWCDVWIGQNMSKPTGFHTWPTPKWITGYIFMIEFLSIQTLPEKALDSLNHNTPNRPSEGTWRHVRRPTRRLPGPSSLSLWK